jgi:C-terminal processing protease CtpA/Prc
MRFTTTLILTGALLIAACGADQASPTDPVTNSDSVNARWVTAHLNEMMAVMQGNSINRLTIDWIEFSRKVLARAEGATSLTAAQGAIREALALLGDQHSSYRTREGTVIAVHTRVCTAVPVSAPSLPATIGYVRVESFVGAGSTDFANSVLNTIMTNDRADLVGWIVDLRGNLGGNMWPMVAGVGPVLGEGIAGYFIDPDGARRTWEYRDGASWLDGAALQRTTTTYRLQRDRPRVAVLTDGRVASSGEAVAVSFRQRPDTRSFGTATCGLSTANRGFQLSEGALLNLTVAVMADRTGVSYGNSIAPDEIIANPDQVVERAVAWLQAR